MPKKSKKGRGASLIIPAPPKANEPKVTAGPNTPAPSKKGSLNDAVPKKSSIEKSAAPAGVDSVNKKVSIGEIPSPEPEPEEPREDASPLDSRVSDAPAVKGDPLSAQERTNRDKARKERKHRRRKSKTSRRSRKKSIAPADPADDSESDTTGWKDSDDDDDDSDEDEDTLTERRRRRRSTSSRGGVRKRDRVKLVDASTNTPPASMMDLVGPQATAAKRVQTNDKATQTGDVIIAPRVPKGTRAKRSFKRADREASQRKSRPLARRSKPRVAVSDTTVVTTELRAPDATVSELVYEETISTDEDSTYDPSSLSSDFSSEDDVTLFYPANVKRRPRKSWKSKYPRSTFDPRQVYSADLARDDVPVTSESLEDLRRLSSYLPARERDYIGAVGRRGNRYAKGNDDADIEEYYKEIREEVVEPSSANDWESEIDNRVGRDVKITQRYNFIDAPEYAGSMPQQPSAFDDRQRSWQTVMHGPKGQRDVSASCNVPSDVGTEALPTQYAFEAPENAAQLQDQPPLNAWLGSAQGATRSTSADPVFNYRQTNAVKPCSSVPCVTVPTKCAIATGTSDGYGQAERQNSSFKYFGSPASGPISKYPANAEPCAFHKSMLQAGQALPLAAPHLARVPTVVHSTCGVPSECHSWMHYCDPGQISPLLVHGTYCCGSPVLHTNRLCVGCQTSQERVCQGHAIQRSRSRAPARICKAQDGEGTNSVGQRGGRDQRGASAGRSGKGPEGATSPGQMSRAPRKAFAQRQHIKPGKRSSGAVRPKNYAEGRSPSKQSATSKPPTRTGASSRTSQGSKNEMRNPCSKRSGVVSPTKSNEGAPSSSAALRQHQDRAYQKMPFSSPEDGRQRAPVSPKGSE